MQSNLSSQLCQLLKATEDRGSRFNILVVDDEEWVRDVLIDFCSLTEACIVDFAANGIEAIRKISEGNYDLVTLDLVMPEMSGLDTLSEIKRLSPRTPVVVVTGNATDKLVNQAGVLGACRVIYKPVTVETFVAHLISMLAR